MITKRLLHVQVALVAGFGSIFLLPHAPNASSAGIAVTLPNIVGAWIGEDAEITQREREVLAKDTQFARKIYTGPQGDQIYVSIVLSGDDMTNSIHRPERCLPAQGWNVERSETRTVRVSDGKQLPVTRLRTFRAIELDNKTRGLLYDLSYYWFIGSREMTPSHVTRTRIDLRDRLLRGQNQRWAYVTVAALVSEHWKEPQRTESETAAMIENFMQKLLPQLHRPNGAPLF
jgi:EpsI family protein